MSVDKFHSMIKALEESGDYRVLTRIKTSEFKKLSQENSKKYRLGAVLDIETTGLDITNDEIIELGIIKFVYAEDFSIVGVIDELHSFIEPTIPLPQNITNLTGITNKMLVGQSIDPRKISQFMQDVSIVVAHNAAFDRRFCEKKWPIFATLPWGCSLYDVNWKEEGFTGASLGILLNEYRYFYNKHRAVDDCYALLKILSSKLPKTGGIVLAGVFKCTQITNIKIWAENAPYELKEELKKRGYKWSDGSNNLPKAWWVLVPESQARNEIEFLRKSIYKKETSIPTKKITAFERYSERENTK